MDTQIWQVGSKVIQAHEILPLLSRYQLMTQFVRNIILDQAIADISCTEEEQKTAIKEFEKQQQITSAQAREAWLLHQGMTLEQMEDLAVRPVLLEKFKFATWGRKIDTYFMTRKTTLDQVVYSLIRTKDLGLAQEVYFRIQEGEQSFSQLAQTYSKGPEADTGGVVGPVPLSNINPTLAKILSISQPGQLWHPTRLEEWFVLVRLEKFLPAHEKGCNPAAPRP